MTIKLLEMRPCAAASHLETVAWILELQSSVPW